MMQRRRLLKAFTVCLAIVVAFTAGGVVSAAGSSYTFSGLITDAGGQPLTGAEVSFYSSSNVKKPADFVSNRTASDGAYRAILPAGDYWAFATLRKDGRRFGPLGLEDKHSGEAVSVRVGDGEDMHLDFVVLDLRAAAKKVQKKNEALLRVSGRILDGSGAPVPLAYAMADTVQRFKEFPKYLSAWTDASGEYLLFMPKGTYYLGASAGFPPDAAYSLTQELVVDKDRSGQDMVIHVVKPVGSPASQGD